MSNKKKPIQIAIFEPVPDKPKYIRYVGNRPVREILEELKDRLKEEDCYPDRSFDTAGLFIDDNGKNPFPDYSRIACFPVTGDSEGHNIHVDVIAYNEELKTTVTQPVFLGKTFQGIDFACKVANACAKHLGA
ncbi:MAG: hypothetical protein AB1633_09005 [Elusimicrobiota bacterium]